MSRYSYNMVDMPTSLVQYNMVDMPTSFTRTIILFYEAFKYDHDTNFEVMLEQTLNRSV
jgi:hypothetical protein